MSRRDEYLRLADYRGASGWGTRLRCPLCDDTGLHLVDLLQVRVGDYSNVRLVFDCEGEHRFYLELAAGKGQCFIRSHDEPEALWE